MSLQYLSFLPLVLLLIVVFSLIIIKNEKRFFEWVECHWFYKRSKLNRISGMLYIAGMSLMIISLLDLRGPEERVVGKMANQKTVILIDSSASMLSEDVRPNRFRKSLLLMKHYVKKAIGQKIAVSVFSDSHKTIVPFTDDYDLIEARINMLEKLELERGGTGLTLAIQESVQYFKNTQESVIGNILIFTDGEETDSGVELDIPEGISVAVVGVGTAKGGVIPIRNSRNEFLGNKKYNGEVVISKLNEKNIKNMGSKLKNYKYWIASSYSLPTEQILDFFQKSFELKMSKNEHRVRPVLFHYIILPAMFLLILGFILNYRKTFYLPLLFVCMFTRASHANIDEIKKKEEPKKSEKTIELENRLAGLDLGLNGQKVLAASLLVDGFPEEAQALFEETLPAEINKNNYRDHFNYATAQIANNFLNLGIEKYNNLLNYMEENKIDDEKLKNELKKNILKALKQNAGGGKGDGKDKEEDEKSKDDKSSEGEGKKEKESKDKDGKKDDKESGKNEERKDSKDKNKKDDKSGEGDKKSEKEVPVLLKQLVSDDNQLQKKLIDAKTTKRKSRKAKDW